MMLATTSFQLVHILHIATLWKFRTVQVYSVVPHTYHMTDHPITPPPELVQQWSVSSPIQYSEELWAYEMFIAHQAARWGADQELEACCHLLRQQGFDVVDDLRAARRPKPPSLKELALEALASADGADHPVVATVLTADQHALIRRALEQLND